MQPPADAQRGSGHGERGIAMAFAKHGLQRSADGGVDARAGGAHALEHGEAARPLLEARAQVRQRAQVA